MMRAGASLTENRFFNNCWGKVFAKTGPILLDSNTTAGILGNLIGGVVFDAIGAKLFYFSVFCLYLISIAIFAGSFLIRRKAPKESAAAETV